MLGPARPRSSERAAAAARAQQGGGGSPGGGTLSERSLEIGARALAELGRRLYAAGQLPATSGNLSLRLDAQSCAITASGTDKGRLEAGDMLAVDLRGQP